jgi:hypothetical protein
MVSAYLLLKKKAQLNHSDFPQLIAFLKTERFYQKFDAISRILLVVSLLFVIFCYIFNVNFLVLISVNILLLFLLWFFGVFNALPDHLSSITLTDKTVISNVYIIEPEGNYVLFLSSDNQRTRLNKDAILTISPNLDNIEGRRNDEQKGVETRIFADATESDLLNFVGALFAFLIAFIFLFIEKTFDPAILWIGYLIGFVGAIILLLILKWAVLKTGDY